MGKLEQVSKQILVFLLNDFQARDLSAESLHGSYVGVSLVELKKMCLSADNTTTAVDFDLALKDLERKKLVSTGPMVAHENSPGSPVVVIGVYSKREYVYLKDGGYKAAR
jgi:hypothetical protein